MDEIAATINVDPIKAAQKTYCSRALLVTVVVAAIFIITGSSALGKGLILGTLFSIVNFLLLGSMVPLKVGHPRKQTLLISLGSLGGRLFLLALPMAAALHTEKYHIVSTVIGIFSVQLMILTDYIVFPVFRKLRGR